MPELPEVECLSKAIRKVVKGGAITKTKFYRKDLRDPIPITLFNKVVKNQKILDVIRRSKYMLLKTPLGYGVIHLGMTGNFICSDKEKPFVSHTHAVFTIVDKDGKTQWLHYIDPRRFGRIDCIEGHDYNDNKFFKNLGPEPLLETDLGGYLFAKSRKRSKPIKNFIMDANIVVGVGNIYAAESLFKTKIHPETPASLISRKKFETLAAEIQATLKLAIKAGGTTFRDFKNADGNPGYFAISLAVYNQTGKPCVVCKTPIEVLKQSGRSSFYCPMCQKR